MAPLDSLCESGRGEADLVGALLVRPDAINEVQGLVSESDFLQPDLRTIFGALLRAGSNDSENFLVAVADVLKEGGQLSAIGGTRFLAELAVLGDGAFPYREHLARSVARGAQKRRIATTMSNLAQEAASIDPGDSGLEVFISNARRDLDEVLFSSPEGNATRKRRANLTCLGDVQPQTVQWLWPHRIALGKLTVIMGDPGIGKSLITMDMAARVSVGAAWPDGRAGLEHTADVILISAEDDPADTIRPRLDEAGGDPARVHILRGVFEGGANNAERSFTLEDLPVLDKALLAYPSSRLVVIDPVSAYMGSKNSHSDAEVRGLLAPLAALAATHNVAVVIVMHPNKDIKKAALHRASGSLAFIAQARTAWIVARDPDQPERSFLVPGKSNIGPLGTGLAFSIQQSEGCTHPLVVWEKDPIHVQADDVLSTEARHRVRPDRDEASEFLVEFLADGPRTVAEIRENAEARMIKEHTLRRARKGLGIVFGKEGFQGEGTWALPGKQITPESSTAEMGTLDLRGHHWRDKAQTTIESDETRASAHQPLKRAHVREAGRDSRKEAAS